MILRDKNIVLGVSGSIAAYKALLLLRLFKEAGAHVWPILTHSATRFVGPMSFSALSGHRTIIDLWSAAEAGEIGHVELAYKADLFVFAPASAHSLHRLATGAADDPLTAFALATRAPFVIAPAMEDGMWENQITQEHVLKLKERGAVFVGPYAGELASGRQGNGRMADPEEIFTKATYVLTPHDLANKKVLVTAGPTREAIDPARFVSNRSSGKMGLALAKSARERGADVHLLLGPTPLKPPYDVTCSRFETNEQLLQLCLTHAQNADIVLMAAAPADFKPAQTLPHKLKKSKQHHLSIDFEATSDILKTLSQTLKPKPFLVGFAAETEHLIKHANEKLTQKNLDMLVANDISRSDIGFETDDNAATLIFPEQKPIVLEKMPKPRLAAKILDEMVKRLPFTYTKT